MGATAVNEITGKIIKSGVDNYKDYATNFDLIGSGVVVNQPETLFPVTIQIPKNVYKAFAEIAKENDTTLEKLIQKQVVSNYLK